MSYMVIQTVQLIILQHFSPTSNHFCTKIVFTMLQDIHCVSSLLKMYFRELPNPVCTYHLYERFVEATKAQENERLVLMRDVVQELPPPNYRTLEVSVTVVCG